MARRRLATLWILLHGLSAHAGEIGEPPVGDLTLFGASTGQHDVGGGPSTFYTIDPATGVVTPVGPIGYTSVTDMTIDARGRLLATAHDPGDDAALLLEIDPATGAGALVGKITDADDPVGCARMPGLAFDPGTSTLYGWGDRCNSFNDLFFTIDPVTGAGSSMDPGQDGCGNALAMRLGGGTLYTTACAFPGGENLGTVDKATGLATAIPGANAPNVPGIQAAASFHPLNDLLYTVHYETAADESYLARVDPDATPPVQEVVGRMRDATDTPVDGFDALLFRLETPADCPPFPSGPCRELTADKKGKLSMKAGKGKLSFSWKQGEATVAADFGAPQSTTGYALCLYDGLALAAGYAVPADAALWKQTKKGWKYKSKSGAPDGVTSLKLAEGPTGKPKLRVKAKGVALPALPFDNPGDQVTAQLRNTDGTCWSAFFGDAFQQKNQADRFQAKSELSLGLKE